MYNLFLILVILCIVILGSCGRKSDPQYEAKINSGDPVSIAEVVRDLHRNVGQPDQSFSERQIYESALERLASEVAAIDGTDKEKAVEKLEEILDSPS